MWQKKKVCLMDQVRLQDVKFWTGDLVWHREIDLPEGLFDKPLLGSFLRDLSHYSFLMAESPFQ